MNYIIGAGGVGSWLAHAMVKLVGAEEVTLMDGDILERKNLDRQLFTENEIDLSKAEALGVRLGCRWISSFYSDNTIEHGMQDWIMCCVDNNKGRRSVLRACDNHGCCAIIAANEVHSSEAYLYHPKWQDTLLDPRKYYPEILTDDSNDPQRAAIGCTGEAQETNRQLVTANFMAAALASHLYVLWAQEVRKTFRKGIPSYLPHRLYQNLTRNGHVKISESTETTTRKEQAV